MNAGSEVKLTPVYIKVAGKFCIRFPYFPSVLEMADGSAMIPGALDEQDLFPCNHFNPDLLNLPRNLSSFISSFSNPKSSR